MIRGTVEDVKVLPQAASAVAAFPSKKTLLPLLLAQFLNSYDSSSMNVAISEIAADLNTTATGVQTALAFYTLVMAASMIANSTLSDIMGIAERERSASLRYALISLGVAGLIGGVAALFLPGRVRRTAAERSSGQLELSAEIESLLPESAPQPPVKNI